MDVRRQYLLSTLALCGLLFGNGAAVDAQGRSDATVSASAAEADGNGMEQAPAGAWKIAVVRVLNCQIIRSSELRKAPCTVAGAKFQT